MSVSKSWSSVSGNCAATTTASPGGAAAIASVHPLVETAVVRDFAPGEGLGAGAAAGETPREGWIDVSVPGDVHRALVDAGLDGIECFHTKHSTATSERYLEIADKYDLLVTGGSDCHGFSKAKPLIGTVKLPYEYVEKLKSRVESRRSKASDPQSAIANPK